MKTTKEKETYSSLRSEGAERREREQQRSVQRMIPLLVFGAVALLIAKEEIPAIDSWIDRLLDADAWNAGEACRKAALAAMEQPDYARLLDPGKVEETSAGYYVGGVEFASLQPAGEERHYHYSCNVTLAGEVAVVSRSED